MQVVAHPSPGPAVYTSPATTTATRLRQTRLFHDYQTAFEGATGLALGLIETPPFIAARSSAPITKGQKSSLAVTDRCQLMISYIPIPLGDTLPACLQLGPFSWRTGGDSTGNPQRGTRKMGRAINRREHRSILRLLGVFVLQLADESDGLILGQPTAEPSFVEAARAYIAAHLKEDIALTTVAAAVKISPYYFCKRFHESTGFHFTEYVNRSRVARVKERLLNPHVHVSEAAFEAGFQSLSQFNRAFRRVVGEAPSDFRHRLHSRLPAYRAVRSTRTLN